MKNDNKWKILHLESMKIQILLTYSIDRHRLLQLNRIRVSGFARVFPSLLLLQRVEEQRQTVILVQFGVHRRL